MKRNVTFHVSPGMMPAEGGVGVLTVKPFTAESKPASQDFIPASALRPGGQSKSVALDPGHYLASFRMPSGRVYSRAFELGESDGFVLTLGEGEKSFEPPELTSSVSLKAGLKAGLAAANPSTARLIRFDATPDVKVVRAALKRSMAEPRTRSFLPRGWTREEVLAVFGRAHGEVMAKPLRSSPEHMSIGVNTSSKDPANRLRYALLLAGKDQSLAARLPGRWRCVSTGADAEVSVDAIRQDDERYRLDVRVSDPDVQSVLGFVLQSDLEGALAVLDSCMDMLAQKSQNPYAAAAAGYVLLNAPQQHAGFQWQDWIGKLGRKFSDDVPDGLILHATLLLQTAPGRMLPSEYFPPDTGSRAKMAGDLLLQAMERGLPLYRAGVRLLASNLRILVADDSLPNLETLRKAQELAAWLLMRLDSRQVFTVVDVTDL